MLVYQNLRTTKSIAPFEQTIAQTHSCNKNLSSQDSFEKFILQ